MDKSEKQLLTCLLLVVFGGLAYEVIAYNALKKKHNQA